MHLRGIFPRRQLATATPCLSLPGQPGWAAHKPIDKQLAKGAIACRAGDFDKALAYGQLLLSGTGVAKDEEAGRRWLERVAKTDGPEADFAKRLIAPRAAPAPVGNRIAAWRKHAVVDHQCFPVRTTPIQSPKE